MENENEYLDEYEKDEAQYEPTRPYTAEELTERAEWCKMMTALVADLCPPAFARTNTAGGGSAAPHIVRKRKSA